jgi:hypothetical protein
MPRILIISDVLPTDSHTAGIVLNQFINFLPANFEILTYNIQSDGLETYSVSNRVTGKMKWTRKPQENWRAPRILLNFLDSLSAHETNFIIKDIVREVSRQSPDLIYLVMQGQTMFRIAVGLNKAGIEFSTFHWDPLSWWLHHNKGPKKLEKLLSSVTPILNSSGYHLLPSPKYAEYLKLTLNNYSVFNLSHALLEKNNKPVDGLMRICFSGQAYAKKELDFFVEVLDKCNWTLTDLKVELHVFGNAFLGDSKNIIHHGWVEPSKLVKQLSVFDCGLLPYPSENEFKEVSNYSFPSKFSTYIAASLPVLFIGSMENPFSIMQKMSVRQVTIGYEDDLISALESIHKNRVSYVNSISKIFDLNFSTASQQQIVNKIFQDYPQNMGVSIVSSISGNSKRLSRDGEYLRYPTFSIPMGKFFYYIQKFGFAPRILTKFLLIRISKGYSKKNYFLGVFAGTFLYCLNSAGRRFKKN